MPQHTSWYTKADLARHFQWPESTVRYYCTRFAAYLPCKKAEQGQGKPRFYSEACLEVFAFIRENLPRLRSCARMESLLAERFLQTEVPAPEKSPSARKQAPRQPKSRHDAWASGTIPAHFQLCQPPHNAPDRGDSAHGHASCHAMPQVGQGDPQAQVAFMALQLLERQGAALDRIADALTSLAGQGHEARALGQRTDMTEQEVKVLKKETETLRLLLDASEKTQQADLEQLRTWMGRILRERNKNLV